VKDYIEKTIAASADRRAFFNNAGIGGKVVPFQDSASVAGLLGAPGMAA
jgi:hypothetical protein